jgi:predicted HTH transcriptional regulator
MLLSVLSASAYRNFVIVSVRALAEKESDRDEQGRFAEQTNDDDILRVIRESEFPAVTAQWVADTVAMERRPVHQRLEELHEQGKLERGKLSPRVVIWWIPTG